MKNDKIILKSFINAILITSIALIMLEIFIIEFCKVSTVFFINGNMFRFIIGYFLPLFFCMFFYSAVIMIKKIKDDQYMKNVDKKLFYFRLILCFVPIVNVFVMIYIMRLIADE